MGQHYTCPSGHSWESNAPIPCPVCGAAGHATPEWTTIQAGLTVSGQPVRLEIPVQTGPVRPTNLLPQFQGVAEFLVQLGVRRVQEEGETVSCKKGCGACCRQLVPISEAEAPHIRDVVNALPEPRRSEVRARFADARRRLAEAGLLDRLEHPEEFPDLRLRPLAQDYFRQGIACPFLEDESCSIYEDRPIACREYLVTSPADHCRRPTAETVRCVPLAGKVSIALTRLEEDPNARFTRWVPLILAPDWADAHPDQGPPRPGPEILREMFERLMEPKKAAETQPAGSDEPRTA